MVSVHSVSSVHNVRSVQSEQLKAIMSIVTQLISIVGLFVYNYMESGDNPAVLPPSLMGLFL